LPTGRWYLTKTCQLQNPKLYKAPTSSQLSKSRCY